MSRSAGPLCCAALSLLAAQASACRREPPPRGAALARLIDAPDQLQWGPAATGALGDVRLDNGRVMAVIGAVDHAVGFAATGGNLVDAASLPDGEDQLNQIFLYLDDEFPRQAKYRSLEIVAPGGPGLTARVRATGVDSHDPRIAIETEYELEPEADWVTLRTRFVSSASVAFPEFELGDAIQWGRADHFGPGIGFDLRGKRPRLPWVAGIGDGTSYAMVPSSTPTFAGPHGAMWSDPIGARVDLLPGRTVEYVRHLVIGRGDVASMSPTIARLRGERTGRVRGRAVTANGSAVAGARVRAHDARGALVSFASVDGAGAYTLDIVPGTYRIDALVPGRAPLAPTSDPDVRVAPGGDTRRDFVVPPPAVIAWRIDGDDGRAPPVRLTFVGVGDTPSPDFGPSYLSRAGNVLLSARGTGEVVVGAGTYRVIVSRGPEYELVDREVRVAEGERPVIEAKIERGIDSRRFISADLHQHAVPSFDSGVSLGDRALSNASEGVDVLVSTEHNVLVDYRSTIATMGLGRVLASIVGTEATTHSVGHFNAFPLSIVRDDPRGGMVDVEGMSPRDIFTFVRRLGERGIDTFIQANHPRAGYIGYFDIMKLSPSTGASADPRFSLDFDGIELVSFGWSEETEQVIADWFGLLRAGRRITGTGGSDSHTITAREVGWPRTYVCADDDAPTRLDPAAFTAALRRGCASVSGGPLIELWSGKARMGDVVTARDGRIEVEVEVQASSWIDTDRTTIYVDGRPTKVLPTPSSGHPRLRARVPVRCTSDCFVVARVDGSRTLAPVLSTEDGRRPTPIALTNPIYVDVDGDGLFHGAPR